jgi:hypothetical protein
MLYVIVDIGFAADSTIDPLQDETYLSYMRTWCIPHSKQSPLWLQQNQSFNTA